MALRLPAPRLIEPESVPALRWGAIGAGGIVRTFTEALHVRTSQRIIAIAARNLERTQSVARDLGIERILTPSQLVDDPGIDVVYVGTPHVSHREYAILAIAAGKHVLVEKPFAITAREGADIASAARAAGVFVMEAMWTRYLPQSDIIRQVLERGDLGSIHCVTADFGFRVPFDPSHRLWNPDLGGGALLDMGVYPLSFASSVIGPPERVSAFGSIGSTGVDTRAAVQLRTADGATAQVRTSIISHSPGRAVIEGTDGRLEVMSFFHAPSGLELLIGQGNAQLSTAWRDTELDNPHHGIAYQATALASYVAESRTESPIHDLDETVSVLATIDAARSQIADGTAE